MAYALATLVTANLGHIRSHESGGPGPVTPRGVTLSFGHFTPITCDAASFLLCLLLVSLCVVHGVCRSPTSKERAMALTAEQHCGPGNSPTAADISRHTSGR